MNELLDSWNYQLGQLLETHLEAGSPLTFLIAWAAGVVTSFTPCVYPMIPVTVSFIGGASGGNRRRAVFLTAFYVAGMAVVYAALGMATALLGVKFGSWTRSPWIYLPIAALMIVFALAMLGKIDIPVPGFAVRAQSEGARRGGPLGALLMGAAAGFVAAPCTAPVLLTLLVYVGRSQNVLAGGGLLLVFAVGLSTLLVLLGIFSGLLASLPRAGIWMERVKVLFGVGMFVAAAYFLYKAVALWTA